jgi:hypothetical protein
MAQQAPATNPRANLILILAALTSAPGRVFQCLLSRPPNSLRRSVVGGLGRSDEHLQRAGEGDQQTLGIGRAWRRGA